MRADRIADIVTSTFVEVFVIIIPPFIALLLGAWALLSPKPVDVVAEQKQPDEHIAWLTERPAHARARNWDEQMMANLDAQMAEARRKADRSGARLEAGEIRFSKWYGEVGGALRPDCLRRGLCRGTKPLQSNT